MAASIRTAIVPQIYRIAFMDKVSTLGALAAINELVTAQSAAEPTPAKIPNIIGLSY